MGTRRSRSLELAVLGHLDEAPMHGYELRKRLNCDLGAFRTFSYGSLYPCLKEMLHRGLVDHPPGENDGSRGHRPRIVYRLTPEGRDHLARLLTESAPAAADDECFIVHFTLFGRTRAEVRLHILASRRSRLLERLECLQERMDRLAEAGTSYTSELNRHRADSIENEVDWLDGLIRRERRCAAQTALPGAEIGESIPPQRGLSPPTEYQQ